MADLPCKKTLEELKREAIAKLKLRGYDVRGKTWAQIRQMLRPSPAKRKSNATSKRKQNETEFQCCEISILRRDKKEAARLLKDPRQVATDRAGVSHSPVGSPPSYLRSSPHRAPPG